MEAFNTHREQGFTLLELMVSVFIIAILSAIMLANFRIGGSNAEVQNASEQLKSLLIKAEALANASTEFANKIPAGYGVHFSTSGEPFIFADLNDDHVYSAGAVPSEKYETRALPNNIVIQSVTGGTALNVMFEPPKLDVYLNGVKTPGTSANVVITNINKPSIQNTITITTDGSITVTQ